MVDFGTMPAFGPDQITAGQLDDLVAYIYALRREKAKTTR